MWDPLVAGKNIVRFVEKKREEAPTCTVCDTKLFDFHPIAQKYMCELEHKKHIHFELFDELWKFFYQHYPYWGVDFGLLVAHHLDYKRDISIPVCSSCHSKIHMSNDPKYVKWKPVDKRPKNIVVR